MMRCGGWDAMKAAECQGCVGSRRGVGEDVHKGVRIVVELTMKRLENEEKRGKFAVKPKFPRSAG